MLGGVDSKLLGTNQKLDRMDSKLSETNQRLEKVETRLEESNKRIGVIDQVIRKIPGLRLDGNP